jgi:PAS domain S-box-containing protein
MNNTPENRVVRILHLEDSRFDAELVAGWLEDDNIACDIKRVQTAAEFQSALALGKLDLIISDYQLPGFDGLKALCLAREQAPEVPFILFSGMIGEELAIDCLKQGATDYVLKQRPQRLVTAVRQAMAGAEDRVRRLAAETKLREQAALIDKAQDAIMVTDMEERITFWNRAAERIYGWSVREALGQKKSALLFKPDLRKFRDALRQVNQKGEWLGELPQVRRDGKALVVESRWSLLRGEQGQPEAVLIINTDVTERKDLEAQFLRAQRMEGIGALAGGIAHDLNNLLAPILMGVDLLGQELPREEKQRMLVNMKGCAQRGAEMVKQILSFARGTGGQARVLQTKLVVAEMAHLAKDTFPRSIRIESKIEPRLPLVLGNATQLHQVLLNLCVNARDAMPSGGDLQIAASHVVLEDHAVKGELKPASGHYVLLSVSDTGHGMSPEVLGKLFQPFFTTKSEGKGTGLGLSTVVGIAKSHNGFVEVTSEVGKGTVFKVYLPAASESAPKAEGGIESLPSGQGEQILVVDDEIAFLEMTRESLEAFNYRVLTAQNGAEAVMTYERQKGEIKAIITDMMMPILDGPASIQQFKAIDPEIMILGVSGLGSEAALARAGKSAVRIFLKKPYTTADLLTNLRKVLDERN